MLPDWSGLEDKIEQLENKLDMIVEILMQLHSKKEFAKIRKLNKNNNHKQMFP